METKNLTAWLMEIMTCTMCGYCKAVCPVFETQGWDSSAARGKVILSYGLLSKEIELDNSVLERLYQCTTCKHCEQKCDADIKVVEIVEACRRDLFENGYILDEHKKIVDNISKYANPFGESRNRLENFGKKPKKAKVGYFIGCVAGYREQNIAKSTMAILDKLNVDYTLIDEVCCGSVLGRIGADYEKLMHENVKKINQLGIETLITSCAGCYRMFKQFYPKKVELGFEVEHTSEFLSKFELDLKKLPKTVTYHDPCHLGRHLNLYDEPRRIIEQIPDIMFKELKNSREHAKCCGAGGGFRAAFREISLNIAKKRDEEAKELGAELFITTCPFCVINLKQAADGIEVKDLTEILAELIK